MGTVLYLVAALALCCLVLATEDLYHVGCFTGDKNSQDVMFRVPTEVSGTSVDACVEECKKKFMRYAALFEAKSCYCGDGIHGSTTDQCSSPCSANATQICGGPGAMSIYETGRGILSAPKSLTQVDSESTSLHINWEPPTGGLSDILHYRVSAAPVFTYSENDPPRSLQWEFSPHIRTAWLYGVQPGTRYLIEVRAVSKSGLGYPKSMEMWTKVGKPETPPMPQIISQTSSTRTVDLQSVPPTNGPISAYQVVVVDETVHVQLQPHLLTDYYSAVKDSIPFYITAEFSPDNFMRTFKVGDKKMYGKYYNAPLKPDIDYHILLGVLSTINETKAAYSMSNHEQHESTVFDYESDSMETKMKTQTNEQLARSQKTVLGLSIAIGLCGFLLVASIILYVVLRVVVKKNRTRSAENQELAVHEQEPNEDCENGYSVGAHYVDEEAPTLDHYRQLKERVWIIPHQGLNIVGDIGTGKFGDVIKGIVINKGNQANVLVHRIADDNLDKNSKSQMLREFDAHVRIGKNPHVISLVGLMEEFNVISVAFEYETSTLKSHLVGSRAVQHYPVYAEKNRRFSTLPEGQALEILLGVARGMNHLASLRVTHGQLCARNVVLIDSIRPKVTGFGLLHYHNDLYVPEYKRWHAEETLRSKVSVPKSDVWSFACLMWEVATLGGTPYADVKTDEVPGRVMRGLRLPQPQYVGDELYQLMLNCWQMDRDERPTFQELEANLQSLLSDDVTPHLLFSLYPSFQYEHYAPHLEFID
ncbi:putative tyrosine-protein kinase Wsck [Penaeus japonicus]|uniref:putative tyrosine-protein kinase Wsck n=1 Tax=Penaeus japonicus TaxID=27405 RepID=UPI001C70EBE2|nr:putative tyrosine-protein kinase Wsck [Penaeus japonicus]